jgi:hypothetical protein
MDQERRRERPNGPRMRRTRWPAQRIRHCVYCCGPFANGRAVCSDECDAGWWEIVPTLSGDLWQPDRPERTKTPQKR